MWVTDEMIRDSVRNKSFADVGPLWQTVHEKVSLAHKFGADFVTAIDQWPEIHPLWAQFKARMHKLKVPNCQCLSMNVMDYNGPPFDVVYCSGVIYHAADPVSLLKKLKSITKEKLILTSTVTKKVLTNSEGTLTLPEGAVIFVPALSPEHKKVVAKEWSGILGHQPSYGLSQACVWDANDYYNWWWLFSPEVLNAMCSSCGFKIERAHLEGEIFYVLALKV